MKILLADDSDIVREGIACEIKKVIPDAEIDDFPDGKYAWEAVQKKTYDLVFTDITMRVMHGPELAERIHSYAPEIPILFMTGEPPLRIQEMGIQMERCILKPVTAAKIRKKINELDSLPLFRSTCRCVIQSSSRSRKRRRLCERKAGLPGCFGRLWYVTGNHGKASVRQRDGFIDRYKLNDRRMNMRRAKQRFKKGMAIILTLVMVVGLVPVMPGSIEKVQAAGGNTPSVTAYATREELMTKFDLDGEDDIVGTICFGAEHWQWYIAGRDSSVKGDNIILFAKESMDDYKFMDVASENVMNNIIISDIPEDNASFLLKNTYEYDNNYVPEEVRTNHYGISKIRHEMKLTSGFMSCFTGTEWALMNNTTIRTYDPLYASQQQDDKECYYTTSDKLYALYGDDKGEAAMLYAGGDNSVPIAVEPYGATDEGGFWLRRPSDEDYTAYVVKLQDTGDSKLENVSPDEIHGVRPAANLDLSSVLFASAAKAASSVNDAGIIESGTAMTLRLDGMKVGVAIGGVECDTAGTQITATKSRFAKKTVSLVVQGNDGSKDWYYSVPVEDIVNVSATDIQSACGLDAAPLLTDCRIWIETTIANVAYAVTPETHSEKLRNLQDSVNSMPTPDDYQGMNAYDKKNCRNKAKILYDQYKVLTNFDKEKVDVSKLEALIEVMGVHAHDGIWFEDSLVIGGSHGSYQSAHLYTDRTLSGNVACTQGTEVDICLHGHTLDLNGWSICLSPLLYEDDETKNGKIPKGATLNIYDCTGDGKIINGKGSKWGGSLKGGAIYVRGSTLNIYGGTIENNDAAWGGAIFIDGSYKNAAGESFPATVNMYGGTIQNNTATSGGGAIEIENSKSAFHMYGGSIINNTVTNLNGGVHKGGGVHFASGTMTVQGKVNITGNTVAGAENNVYLRSGKTVTVNGLEEGSRIGVSAYTSQTNVSDPTVVTDGYGANVSSSPEKDIKYFFMDRTHDKSTYALEHNDTELQIKKHKHTWAYCSNGNKDGSTWGDTTVNANQFKAKCIDEAEYCAFHPNILTLSLQAGDKDYTGSPYKGIHYDDEEEEKIWNYAGIDMPEITYTGFDVDDTAYGPSTTAPTDVGSYKATMKLTSDEQEYTAESRTFKINKVDSVCTAPTEKTELIYDGSAQALVNEGSTLDERSSSTGTMYYRLGVSGDWTTTVPTATNAGEYTVYYYVEGDKNHDDCGSKTEPEGSVTVTIGKKPLANSMITLSVNSYEYDGNTSRKPEISVKDGNPSIIAKSDYEISGDGTTSQSEVGEYTVMVTAKENGNYKGIAVATWTIIGSESLEAGKIHAAADDTAYDGKGHGINVTTDYEGATVLYSETEDGLFDENCPTITDVGTKTIWYKVKKSGYNVYKASATVTVTAKPLTATVVAKDKSYDGTTTATVEATVASGVDGEEIAITGVTGTFGDKSVGTSKTVAVDNSSAVITVTGGQAKAENYDITIPTASLSADITQKEVTITASATNREYNGSTEVAVSGEVTTADGLVGSEKVTVTGGTGRMADANAGTGKEVIISGMTLAGDDADNYTLKEQPTTRVDITPKAITVNAKNAEKTYGEADPILSFEVDSATPLVGIDMLSGITVTRAEGEAVNTYEMKASQTEGANPNYDITFQPGTFTINKAELTVTPDSNQSKVFGDDEPTLTYTVSGLANGDTKSVISGALTRAEGENAGDYAITKGTLTADNYTITVAGDVKFTILPKSLEDAVITLSPGTKVYTGSDITQSISKVMLGETELTTDDYTVDSTSDLTKKEYGTYTVKINGKGNYTGSATVQWKITKQLLTGISAQDVDETYDGTPKTIRVTGVDNSMTVTYKTIRTDDYSGDKPEFTNAGEYTVYYKVVKDENYEPFEGSATVTIVPKAVTVKAKNAGKTYGEADPALSFEVDSATPLVGTDKLSGITVTRAEGEAVNTYEMKASQTEGANPNYAITFQPGTFTINKAVLTVTPDSNQSKVFGDADPTLTYTVSGLANGDTKSVISGALTRAEGENAGDYAITKGTLSADNYTITVAGAVKFTILPKSLEEAVITLDKGNQEYTGNDITQSISKVMLGETELTTDDYTVDSTSDLTKKEYGTYTVKINGKGNYTGSATVQWEITKQLLTGISAPDVEGVSYDGTPKTITITGVDNSMTVTYKTKVTDEYSGDKPEFTNAGEYTVYYKVVKDENYEPFEGSAKVTIDKADLTLTAKAAESVYGNAIAALEYEVTDGTIYSQGSTKDDLKISVTTTVNAGDNVGVYEDAVTIAYDTKNYNVTAVPADYTVTKRNLVIKPNAGQKKVYGAEDEAFTYTTDNLLPGDTLSGSLARAEGENVGTYAYSIGNLVNDNYNISLDADADTFEITRKPLDPAMIYVKAELGGGVTAVVMDSLPGKTVTLKEDVDYTVTVNDANGIYEVTVEGIGNYRNPENATVSKKVANPSWNGNIASTVVIDPSVEEAKTAIGEVPQEDAKNLLISKIEASKAGATEEEKAKIEQAIAAIESGSGADYNALLYVEMKDAKDIVTSEEKEEIANIIKESNKIASDATVGMYLDLSLFMTYYVTNGDDVLASGTEKITDTSDSALGNGQGFVQTVKITVPTDLRPDKENVRRIYNIVRVHEEADGNQITEVLDTAQSGYELTFKTDKFSVYAVVYSDEITPSSVSVDKATHTITEKGGSVQLTATVEPADAVNKKVTWTTSDPKVATVDENGKVTAVGNGTCTITVITEDGQKTAECKITVNVTNQPDNPNQPGNPSQPDTSSQPDNPGTTEETQVAKQQQEENALTLNAKLKVSQTKRQINIAWGKVSGADGYNVYVAYCGSKFTKKSLNQVKSGKTTKITVKKVDGKKLNLKKNYKIYVEAYKMVDGKQVKLGQTITAHIVGRQNYAYTNVKSIKLSKNSYTLKKGKTATIKAKTVLVDKTKKQLTDAHAKEFRYATDNKKVATVSSKGKIKAVGKGTCTIYVYARNGYAKKVKVTVK